MIIDAHTHVWKYEIDGRTATPEMLQKAMKDAGVEYALVIAGEIPSYESLPSSRELIELLEGRENLFVIAAVSPSTLTSERLDELEDHMKTGKVKGVKLYLGYEHYYPNDERLTPLYELAARQNIPVVFHTGFLWDPDNMGLAKYANPLGIDEVAVRFPKLNVVIAHMGNPWLVECAVVAQKNPNVYIDVSGYFAEFVTPFSEEEKRMFLADLERLHGLIGPHRKLLYGTDWPLYDMKDYVHIASQIPLTAEERDLFFWKNAAELFRIPTGGNFNF